METETKTKVLIIESEPLQRDLMQLGLKRNGFDVFLVDDASKMPESIMKIRPDIILLDMFLPRMNGLELMKKLRADGLLVGIKVVAISSMAFKEVVQQAGKLGVEDFLVKPFDIDLLAERLYKLLEKDQ